MTASDGFVRGHLLAALVLTCVTAWGSYAYFHLDEYFQVLEYARFALGQVDAWSLPWEHAERIRPWLQPALYVVVGKAMGPLARDPFVLGFACRLVTGLLSWGSLVLFVRATLPLVGVEAEQRLHVRVATLLGFLPYLFVRTSSETLSMAALTAALAVVLRGCSPAEGASGGEVELRWTGSAREIVVAGALFGLAFEARYQTAILALGVVAWLAVVARAGARRLLQLVSGGAAVVGLAAIVDAWGYGAPAFPPLGYVRANLLEGAASLFGADPPFSYVWMSPANVVAPLVLSLLVLAPIAWFRHRRHPITWATLPFFFVHNVLSHKEERFLFPMAILATAFVVMAIGPTRGRPLRLADVLWSRRRGAIARGLAAWSTVWLLLLAVWPIGWHHHVPFMRHARRVFGDEMRVAALPDFELGLPAYHPRVYDVQKLPAEELARRLEAGTAPRYLVADQPRLATGVPAVDARARLLWSEMPLFDDPVWSERLLRLVAAYEARARPPLRPLRFRSLYVLEGVPAAGAH